MKDPESIVIRVTVAMSALEVAQENFNIAKSAEDLARSRKCEATNTLSRAQKELDALVEEMKKGADRDSKWGQERVSNLHSI